MKKTNLFLFLVFTAFALGSCKKDSSEPDNFISVNITSSMGNKSFTCTEEGEDYFVNETSLGFTISMENETGDDYYEVEISGPNPDVGGTFQLTSSQITIDNSNGSQTFSSNAGGQIIVNKVSEDEVSGSFTIPQITSNGKTASATGNFRFKSK